MLLKFKTGRGSNNKDRVVVDPRSLMLAPFLDIWNNDQTVTKDYANDLLCYIHLISQLDPEAPFYNASYDEVKLLAKSQIFRNMEHQFNEEEEIVIQNALDVYIKDNEVAEERMLQVYDRKLDEMRLELEVKKVEITRNVNTMTSAVTYTTNAKIITSVMKEIGEILQIKEDLRVQIENARAKGDKRIKGQRDPSFLEKQLNKSLSDERARKSEQANSGAAPGGGDDYTTGPQVHRQEQPDVQEDGSEPQNAQAGSQKALPAAGRVNKTKYRKAPATASEDEEF